jgi:nucleoside-diphosphate-sugar epimerase
MINVIVHGPNSFLARNFISSLEDNKDIFFTLLCRETSNLQFLADCNIEKKILRYKYSLEEISVESIKTDIYQEVLFLDFSWSGVYNDKRNHVEQIIINIPMVINSIKLAHKLNCDRYVGFGSQAEYGVVNETITESTLCNPTTLYGKSKLMASEIAREMCDSYSIGFTWFRIFSLYGPNDNHKWFVHYLIDELRSNSQVNMTLGEQLWDYLYIDDAVDILWTFVKKNKNLGVVNYASGNSIKLKDFVLIAKDSLSSSSNINFGAVEYRNDQVMNMKPDISKMQAHLNWSPSFSYERGLEKFIKVCKN